MFFLNNGKQKSHSSMRNLFIRENGGPHDFCEIQKKNMVLFLKNAHTAHYNVKSALGFIFEYFLGSRLLPVIAFFWNVWFIGRKSRASHRKNYKSDFNPWFQFSKLVSAVFKKTVFGQKWIFEEVLKLYLRRVSEF